MGHARLQGPGSGIVGTSRDPCPHDHVRAALRQIDVLGHADRNTPEWDRLHALATLLEAFERGHCPMDRPDPMEAIQLLIERQGLNVEGLEPAPRWPIRICEVLNRTRPLTVAMIHKLRAQFGIPAEVLIEGEG